MRPLLFAIGIIALSVSAPAHASCTGAARESLREAQQHRADTFALEGGLSVGMLLSSTFAPGMNATGVLITSNTLMTSHAYWEFQAFQRSSVVRILAQAFLGSGKDIEEEMENAQVRFTDRRAVQEQIVRMNEENRFCDGYKRVVTYSELRRYIRALALNPEAVFELK